jgi:uncharacterized FlgJ-related protein
MIYTFNKENLTFNKVKFTLFLKISVGLALFGLLSFTSVYNSGKVDSIKTYVSGMSSEEKAILIKTMNVDTFSLEALVGELKRLNIRYPHIVLAQSMIESGQFQSNIFRANNNLFGMKEAHQRATTAIGTNLGHAYYSSWKESVMDYALFQSAYLRDLKSEKAYLEYLDKNYAEAMDYDNAVLNMINKHNLKQLFK